jgi:hypothetical protein
VESLSVKILSDSTVWRLLNRMGFSLGFSQKNGAWGRWNGTNGRESDLEVMAAGEIDPKRLVFVDEMGTNTPLSPLCAWSRRGVQARWSVPRNPWTEYDTIG